MRRDYFNIKFILLFCILSVRRANVITFLIYLWAVPYSNFESLMTHWIRINFQQKWKYSIWWIGRSDISAECRPSPGLFLFFLFCLTLLCSSYTVRKCHPECTKTHHFQIKNQFFLGRARPPPTGHPLPTPHPSELSAPWLGSRLRRSDPPWGIVCTGSDVSVQGHFLPRLEIQRVTINSISISYRLQI